MIKFFKFISSYLFSLLKLVYDQVVELSKLKKIRVVLSYDQTKTLFYLIFFSSINNDDTYEQKTRFKFSNFRIQVLDPGFYLKIYFFF